MPNSLASRPRTGGRFHIGTSIIFSVLLLVTSFTSGAGEEGAEGRWSTQGKSGVVEIYGCDRGTLCGRLVWFGIKPNETDPLTIDRHNPDPALRNRPVCGLVIMWGMQPDGLNRWSDGSLYDPESGNTYSGNITFNPDGTLSLRGYLGIALLGRTEHWTRFTQAIGRCPGEQDQPG